MFWGGKYVRFLFFITVFLAITSITVFAAPQQDVYDRSVAEKTAVIADLETMVNIDSGTGDEQGALKMGDFLIPKLQELGAKIELIPAKAPGGGNHIIATLEGNGKGDIMMMAHLDTVFNKGEAIKRPFKIDGNKAYGPGVSDMKGGLSLALHSLKLLKDMNYTNYHKLTLVIVTEEEKGSANSKELTMKLAKEHKYAIGLEPGIPGDAVMNFRKGIGYYSFEVKGVPAHAGIRPQDGRNAAVEMCYQVMQMRNLGNPAKDTTVNWTILKSGEKSNIIPDYAYAQADVRVLYMDEYDRIEKDMLKITQNKLIPDTTIKVNPKRGRPPFAKSMASDAFAQKFVDIYKELGMTLKVEGSGGGSDAGFTSVAGAISIDGLGIVGGCDHTPDEYIELNSVSPRLYLLTRMLMDLGAGIEPPIK